MAKRPSARHRGAEQEMRDQEVLRANRELAAYFKGRRTEREARAALKIIKAFLRERERSAPADRRPLPGTGPGRTASLVESAAAGRKRRKSRASRVRRKEADAKKAAHDDAIFAAAITPKPEPSDRE